MDIRRLGLTLILGGAAMLLLAFIWFAATFAEAMDTASAVVGNDHAARFLACLYSSGPVCQGASMFSDGPAYPPAVFWLGTVAVLAGIALRVAAGRGAMMPGATMASSATATDTPRPQPAAGEIMGFIPPAQYARYSYVLALSGAVAGLLIAPIAILALGGFALAMLGLTVFRPRMSRLDADHLTLICLIFTAAALLLFLSRGTVLFLLFALLQIAAFHVAFHSYRGGRTVTTQNLKEECLRAFQPGRQPHSGHEPARPTDGTLVPRDDA